MIYEDIFPVGGSIKMIRCVVEKKTIVFCHTFDDCSYICFYRASWGERVCNPLEYQICHDLGFAFTEKNIKDNILKMFIHPNGTVRIVIATMGLDRPNVRNIIHWGTSNNVEAYIQETGRAGMDGEPAKALLNTYQNVGIDSLRSP